MAPQCSDPIVHGLGEIVIAFGNLELYVSAAIWQMLATDDKVLGQLAQAVTAEMSFDRKLHALSSMFKLRSSSAADNQELATLVTKLNRVQQIRNQVLHSHWPLPRRLDERMRVKSSAKIRRGLQTRAATITAGDIAAMVIEMARVGQEFAIFVHDKIQPPRKNTTGDET